MVHELKSKKVVMYLPVSHSEEIVCSQEFEVLGSTAYRRVESSLAAVKRRLDMEEKKLPEKILYFAQNTQNNSEKIQTMTPNGDRF